jgi:CRP/FNR family transcriptional regulator, anaerobic regulatory protein
MSLLKDYLGKFVNFTPTLEKVFFELCTIQEIPKKTHLFRSGDICHHVHFIEKGFARVYYLLDGRDVTSWFAQEGQVMSAKDSLFTGKPSDYNIQLLEDSKVISINYRKLESKFDEYPALERAARLITIESYLQLDDRIKNILFYTPEERYLRLLESYPNITTRISLGYIASYLGITQETLSRVRARV